MCLLLEHSPTFISSSTMCFRYQVPSRERVDVRSLNYTIKSVHQPCSLVSSVLCDSATKCRNTNTNINRMTYTTNYMNRIGQVNTKELTLADSNKILHDETETVI